MSEVRVVTRYGGYKHKPYSPPRFPYEKRERMGTWCAGTSAWAVEEWEREPDHPTLTIEEIKALPDCPKCFPGERWDTEPDFSTHLKVCTEEHGASYNAATVYGHMGRLSRRNCIRIKKLDIWVYDPKWEE